MKVAVTGGAGFIGSHVVDILNSNGVDVVIIDNLSTGSAVNVHARLLQMDITDPRLAQVLTEEHVEGVIHLAAQVSVQRSMQSSVLDAESNVLGSINVFQACVDAGVKKVVYASSAAVYGNPSYLGIDEIHPINPISPYGISKFTPERYLPIFRTHFGLNYVALRFANVYGPRQSVEGEGGVVSVFATRLLRGIPVNIHGSGEQTRDFIFVKDVAQACVRSLTLGDGETINISSGHGVTINSLYETMKVLSGAHLDAKNVAPRSGDIMHSFLVNKRALKVIDWEPQYSLTDGLAETVEFYRGR